jgi:hypothetical protein
MLVNLFMCAWNGRFADRLCSAGIIRYCAASQIKGKTYLKMVNFTNEETGAVSNFP